MVIGVSARYPDNEHMKIAWEISFLWDFHVFFNLSSQKSHNFIIFVKGLTNWLN